MSVPAGSVGSQSKATVADRDRVARLGARLGERLLDAEPGQPVGQVADGLVVGEVGLPDPALGLARRGPRSALAVAWSRSTVNPASSTARGRDGRSGRAPAAGRRARCCSTTAAIAKPSSRSPSPVAALIANTCSPRSSSVGADQVGQLAGVRDVDLVEHTIRGRPTRSSSVAAVGGQLRLDHVEVGDRVAAGLERRAVEHVHEHGAALDVAQELQAQALALGRPGSGRARRRR